MKAIIRKNMLLLGDNRDLPQGLVESEDGSRRIDWKLKHHDFQNHGVLECRFIL